MALSILTVVLLSAWGGLHFKAAQEQQLAAAAGSGGNGFRLMPEDVLRTPPPKETEAPPEETAAPTATPEQQTNTGGNSQASGGSGQAPAQSEQRPQATPVPQQNNNAAAEAQKQETVVEKYKNEIVQVQLACTAKLNDLRLKGEAGLAKLDKMDTEAVDAFYADFVADMENSQASCEQNFMGKLASAEKEGVPSATISEWTGTFRAIMLKLQTEFEVALKEYMMQ
jgi:hypothetical protein